MRGPWHYRQRQKIDSALSSIPQPSIGRSQRLRRSDHRAAGHIRASPIVPIAKPTLAAARAGASLIPSPTMPTMRPDATILDTACGLSPGSTSPWHSSTPARAAIASAVFESSAVSMTVRISLFFNRLITSLLLDRKGSAIATIPNERWSVQTTQRVLPSSSSCATFSASNATLPLLGKGWWTYCVADSLDFSMHAFSRNCFAMKHAAWLQSFCWSIRSNGRANRMSGFLLDCHRNFQKAIIVPAFEG